MDGSDGSSISSSPPFETFDAERDRRSKDAPRWGFTSTGGESSDSVRPTSVMRAAFSSSVAPRLMSWSTSQNCITRRASAERQESLSEPLRGRRPASMAAAAAAAWLEIAQSSASLELLFGERAPDGSPSASPSSRSTGGDGVGEAHRLSSSPASYPCGTRGLDPGEGVLASSSGLDALEAARSTSSLARDTSGFQSRARELMNQLFTWSKVRPVSAASVRLASSDGYGESRCS